MKTLEEYLTEKEIDPEVEYPCTSCGKTLPPFALVYKNKTTQVCANCVLDAEREQIAETEANERLALEQNEPWNTDYGIAMKMERNRLIDAARWAVDPLTSPLSAECQENFVSYIGQLNRLTLDFATPSDVVWPTVPPLTYPETD